MALRDSTSGFFSYVHLVGSPAFLLANIPGMDSIVPKLRSVVKNHNRSLRSGPPSDWLTSQLLYTWDCVRPRPLRRSSRLLPWDQLPALLAKKVPASVLPPVFGMMLTLVPPVSASPSPPERVRFSSWAFGTS